MLVDTLLTPLVVSLPRRNLAIWNEMSEDEQKGIAAGEPSEAAREAAAGLVRAMLTEQGIDVDAALVRKPHHYTSVAS